MWQILGRGNPCHSLAFLNLFRRKLVSSVFKYTDYRPEFFDNFYLKVSRFGEFNDPFEMVMGNYLSSVSEEECEEIMSMSPSLSDGASYYDFAADAQCGVRASVGVLCFASIEDNLLMWAHYANNHAGICIEFDRDADFFNGKYKNATKFFDKTMVDHYKNIGELRKVDYELERPTYIEPSELEYDTESWFVKSPEWKYEEEQRLLLPLDLAKRIPDMNIPFYPVEPKIIKSIILGCQMPVNIKKEVVKHCNKHGIKVRESFIHSHQFKLHIVDYEESNQGKYHNMYNLNRITSW
ncbi:DUF2971 domain-containing protein [Vibrio crassostreae]|nr:DUF2971 domain-containing protein [Vibrio crassostreae]CAK2833470.1 DUF2971 domain-containing protein [Vibrio crassostreae]CAK2838254.1 DUF2971 domain-containing protein [Vibrio crassostreae]CAK2840271.1 DUF2971 domain-containing protein [Vibrio crassostreae]CAK2923094.1 DUF2971 domain-containing protein [Vibrio crassostreae]